MAAPANGVAEPERLSAESASLGTVHFSTSCRPELQPDFNRAVALLHSFWYKKSEESFAAIAKADPSCGMAEWGVAMTHYHEVWDPPSNSDLRAGWSAVERAKAAGARTQRERDYIAAMEIFYEDADERPHA
ncbi:MAG: hypothetical protein ACRD51_00485, partial [Candidatus Acidiferrum sp.]